MLRRRRPCPACSPVNGPRTFCAPSVRSFNPAILIRFWPPSQSRRPHHTRRSATPAAPSAARPSIRVGVAAIPTDKRTWSPTMVMNRTLSLSEVAARQPPSARFLEDCARFGRIVMSPTPHWPRPFPEWLGQSMAVAGLAVQTRTRRTVRCEGRLRLRIQVAASALHQRRCGCPTALSYAIAGSYVLPHLAVPTFARNSSDSSCYRSSANRAEMSLA